MKIIAAMFVTAFMLVSIPAFAQMQKQVHGEEHDKLNFLAGEWNTLDKVSPNPYGPGSESTGKISYHWEMENLWLVLDYNGEIEPMGVVISHGLMSYDPESKEYVLCMFGNFNAYVGVYRGDWEDANTLVLTGKIEYEGMTYHERFKWVKAEDGAFHLFVQMSMDGQNYQTMVESIHSR